MFIESNTMQAVEATVYVTNLKLKNIHDVLLSGKKSKL
jgi:hypothetical protein